MRAAIIACFPPVVAADMLDGCKSRRFFRGASMDRAERRRLMYRGFGLFAVILGLSVATNAAVMLGAGAPLAEEARLLVPSLVLLGLGGWLWWKSRA